MGSVMTADQKLAEIKKRVDEADDSLCNAMAEKYPLGLDLGPHKSDVIALIEAGRILSQLIENLPPEIEMMPADGPGEIIYLNSHNALRQTIIDLILQEGGNCPSGLDCSGNGLDCVGETLCEESARLDK